MADCYVSKSLGKERGATPLTHRSCTLKKMKVFRLWSACLSLDTLVFVKKEETTENERVGILTQ